MIAYKTFVQTFCVLFIDVEVVDYLQIYYALPSYFDYSAFASHRFFKLISENKDIVQVAVLDKDTLIKLLSELHDVVIGYIAVFVFVFQYTIDDRQVFVQAYFYSKPTAFPVTPDGSGYSYTLSNGNIKIWDGTEYTIEGDFSNLKVFAGTVYAMNGNILNKITPPQTAEPLGYEIADFSATSAISIGNTVEALDSYNIEKPHFTALKSGEYLTEVHLDAKSFDKASVSPTDYFKVGRTVKVGEEAGFNAGMSAVVLCETGNAHIISLNGKQYIKLAAAATARDFIEAEFSSAQINVPSDYIYSSPTVCDAAKLRAVSWGESVTVLGKLLKSTSPEIPCDFYKIALKDENGTEVTGYTPCSFVFEKKENNDEDKTDDPSPSNADSVKTVVLVLIVVVLVLVAVGYVTFVFTSDKKRKNK